MSSKSLTLSIPTAAERMRSLRSREQWFFAAGLLLALAGAGVLVLLGAERWFVPLLGLLGIPVLVVVWSQPRVVLYTTLAAVCLIELLPTPYTDALTDRVPLFWNINTIVQTYMHTDFKGVPINPLELLFLVAGSLSLLRAVLNNSLRIVGGTLVLPIVVYLVAVAAGLVNGLLTGGDFKIALTEVRPQFHLLFAYLIGVNLIREKSHVSTLLWIFASCVAFKGALYAFRCYVTLAGKPVPDGGVGSHEEAFFFDAFISLLLALWVCRAHARLQWMMLVTLPLVVIGNLACNRRASTAAFIVIVPILFAVAIAAIPKRRKAAIGLAVIFSITGTAYYYAFRNSTSLFAQPARALHSQFEPNARDTSSNSYRDAENANLMATIKHSPIVGWGFGKPMLLQYPMADISEIYEFWNILPHNQVLWVWMRIGTLGFIAFWFMICAFVFQGCLVVKEWTIDPDAQAVGLFSILVVGLLLMFGLLDLQLSNLRDMILVGIWMGAIGGQQSCAAATREKSKALYG